ncbi:hypothetical protein CKX96_00310 [Staphylococcus argenteus]|nr:hypothetical protein CKX96_00310 [Staphylococcus argenteus]
MEQAFFQYWGPNTEGDGKSAVINVKVGDGPQHREFQQEIQQTMKVEGRPRHREFQQKILQTMQVGDGAPT